MKCQDVMTQSPAFCLKTDPVSEAARLMRGEDVGPIPVVDDPDSRRVVGIVTDRDITVKVVAEERDPSSTAIQEIMTRDLVTCQPDDDIEDAIDAMSDHQVRRVLVVDSSTRLLGIISQADVATRVGKAKQTGEVVREISQPENEF